MRRARTGGCILVGGKLVMVNRRKIAGNFFDSASKLFARRKNDKCGEEDKRGAKLIIVTSGSSDLGPMRWDVEL